jgi:hypothetical protein
MATGRLSPIGLFIYGWTAQWAVPLFGTLLFGIGILGALICIQVISPKFATSFGTSLTVRKAIPTDAYTRCAASTVAVNTVLRSIVGGFLPLAGLKMYDKLGLGWGNSLLGFIALAMVPIPFVFYTYGERIKKSRELNL